MHQRDKEAINSEQELAEWFSVCYLPRRQVKKRVIMGLEPHERACWWKKEASEFYPRAL